MPKSEIIEVFISSWERDIASLKTQIISEVINEVALYADTFALAGLPDAYAKAVKSLDKIGEVFAEFTSRSPHNPLRVLSKIGHLLRQLNLNILLIIEDIDRDPAATDHDINALAAFLDTLNNVDNIGIVVTMQEDSLTKSNQEAQLFDPNGLLRRVFHRKEYMPKPKYRQIISGFNASIIKFIPNEAEKIHAKEYNNLSENWEESFESIRHLKQTLGFIFDFCKRDRILEYINYNDLFILSAIKYSTNSETRKRLPKINKNTNDLEIKNESEKQDNEPAAGMQPTPLSNNANLQEIVEKIERTWNNYSVIEINDDYALPSHTKLPYLWDIYLQTFQKKEGLLVESPQTTLLSLKPFMEGGELRLSQTDNNFDLKILFISNLLTGHGGNIKNSVANGRDKLIIFIDRLFSILNYKNENDRRIIIKLIHVPLCANWHTLKDHDFTFYHIKVDCLIDFMQLMAPLAGTDRIEMSLIAAHIARPDHPEAVDIYRKLHTLATERFQDPEFDKLAQRIEVELLRNTPNDTNQLNQ